MPGCETFVGSSLLPLLKHRGHVVQVVARRLSRRVNELKAGEAAALAQVNCQCCAICQNDRCNGARFHPDSTAAFSVAPQTSWPFAE